MKNLTQLKLDNNIVCVITQSFNWNTDCLSICSKFSMSTQFFADFTIGMIGNETVHLLKCVKLYRKFILACYETKHWCVFAENVVHKSLFSKQLWLFYCSCILFPCRKYVSFSPFGWSVVCECGIARPLGMHYNHYFSHSVRPLPVSENVYNSWTTWYISFITFCIYMHVNIPSPLWTEPQIYRHGMSNCPACCALWVHEMLITLNLMGHLDQNLHSYLFWYCPATDMDKNGGEG